MTNAELQILCTKPCRNETIISVPRNTTAQNVTVNTDPRCIMGMITILTMQAWLIRGIRVLPLTQFHSFLLRPTERDTALVNQSSLPAAESYLSSPTQQYRGSPSPPLFLSAHNGSESRHRSAQWQRRVAGNPQKVAFCVSALTGIHLSVVPCETIMNRTDVTLLMYVTSRSWLVASMMMMKLCKSIN